jgi:hypothetical protein
MYSKLDLLFKELENLPNNKILTVGQLKELIAKILDKENQLIKQREEYLSEITDF